MECHGKKGGNFNCGKNYIFFPLDSLLISCSNDLFSKTIWLLWKLLTVLFRSKQFYLVLGVLGDFTFY